MISLDRPPVIGRDPLLGSGFAPDARRASRLDARMRSLLAGSLEHIAERGGGYLYFDSPALQRIIDRLNAGVRLPPAVFAHYTQLALALFDDRLDEAERRLEAIARLAPQVRSLELRSLDDAFLIDVRSDYETLMAFRRDDSFRVLPPDAAQCDRFVADFEAALDLLRQATPELAGEFDALVSELIMLRSAEGTTAIFDGGSCYMLWGALFINVGLERSLIDLAEVLAHESAHMLLYALSADEALVLNDDEERFPSPLRVDPRPMDGIFHATFVSARMHWTMARVIESGLLDAKQRDAAVKAMLADVRNFEAGMSVIDESARLTNTGRAIIESARDWMLQSAVGR